VWEDEIFRYYLKFRTYSQKGKVWVRDRVRFRDGFRVRFRVGLRVRFRVGFRVRLRVGFRVREIVRFRVRFRVVFSIGFRVRDWVMFWIKDMERFNLGEFTIRLYYNLVRLFKRLNIDYFMMKGTPVYKD